MSINRIIPILVLVGVVIIGFVDYFVAVSKRLGHSNVAMTLEIYTHLLQKNDDELIKNLESNFIHINQ